MKKEIHDLKHSVEPIILFVPLLGVLLLCILFVMLPAQSEGMLSVIRSFLGDEMGVYYVLLGLFSVLCSFYMAFSKYGTIVLGDSNKPTYSTFKWGAMIFTSTMAADILFYSCCEWALYASDPYVTELGVQAFAPVFPLFHWGPIAWSFYIVLAVAFGFMIHVRKRKRQKFSEACRPLFGDKMDRLPGKVIDLFALFALLAGTATTFSLATPLLAEAAASILGLSPSVSLSIMLLLLIAVVYTLTVLKGMSGISKLANFCTYLFFVLLLYVLIGGGEAIYIIETGVNSLGTLVQNFFTLSTYTDPLRENMFPQNWTIFYWAYWLAWCIATPFFIGKISKGRTIKSTVLGGYLCGLSGTFTSFIILGNYGLAQQMKHGLDTAGFIADGGAYSTAIIRIFNTLPLPAVALILLIVTMIAFYSTTFDTLTMVVASYSYKELKSNQEPDKRIKIFWAVLFILLPIALIFSKKSISNLQSVSIIAAFPVGIILLFIVASFFKDAREYLGRGDGNL